MNKEKLRKSLLIIFNSLVVVIGVLFFGWNTNTAICYYWVEIWIFAFFNIIKAIVIARNDKNDFIGWFILIMFGVVGLSVTNIVLVAFIEPDLSELNEMRMILFVLFVIHSGYFIDYILQKKYIHEEGNVLEGIRFANKAAVSLIFIVACDGMQSILNGLSKPQNAMMIPLFTLIAVRTFFDLRGGFLKI